jgi:hypothetical protein
MPTNHSQTFAPEFARLSVELSDIAQSAIWRNALGPEFLRRNAFGNFKKELERTWRAHRRTGLYGRYEKWWNDSIGHIGRRPLTRKILAQRKTCPRNWALN